MSKCVSINVKRRFITELGDLRELDRKNQEKSRAYARLKQIRDEEEKLDADIETFKNELTEFKRFIHEESLKVENLDGDQDHLDVIAEYESSIDEGKRTQKAYADEIRSVEANIEELKEVVRLTKAHIEYYKPYEKCVAEVIAKNPQYKDVFHIIEHVEELANVRSLGSRIVLTDAAENKRKTNVLPEIMYNGQTNRKNYVELKTDFNDARAYGKHLKQADLTYIRKQLGAEIDSDYNVKFSQVNPDYVHTSVDKIVNERKQLETDIPMQQIRDRKTVKQEVIRLISHQYREIYLKNNDKLPAVLPSTEDQLAYLAKFLKKSMKRLEIYRDVIQGKMRIKEYVLKGK